MCLCKFSDGLIFLVQVWSLPVGMLEMTGQRGSHFTRTLAGCSTVLGVFPADTENGTSNLPTVPKDVSARIFSA